MSNSIAIIREGIIGCLDWISRLNSRKSVFILIILIGISYINSLGVYFIWDDYATVVSNPVIRSSKLKNIFKPLYQNDDPQVAKTPVYSRPLQVLSYMFDYRVWKLNPFGYHITNISLHGANTVLLYFLLLLLFKDSLFAFLGAGLFAANPIFTSSVTYISGRADILSLFFVLLMLIAFIKSIQKGTLNIFFYCLALSCFFLLLLSKEIGIVSVALLVMIDKLIYKYSITKIRTLIYAPFVLVLLFWLSLKSNAAPGFSVSGAHLQGLPLGFLALLKAMSTYTFLSIFPFHLRMGRSITAISTLQDGWVYISLVFLISIIILCIQGLRKNKLMVLGLFWFYTPLFIGVLFNYFFAKRGNELLLPEHNLYFCYIGFLIFCFSVIASFALRANAKKYLTAVFLAILIFYAGLTISENFIWQDEVRFFEANIKKNKDSAFNFMAYANLGFAYERAEKFRQAEESFKMSAERSGQNPYFYNMLASFYIRNEDFDKALDILMFSKELDGSFYNTYLLTGMCYASKGETLKARHNFEKAILLNPADSLSKRYIEALKGK